MDVKTKQYPEVWAKLMLSQPDCDRAHEFFAKDCGIKDHRIERRLHITVYYARRFLPNLAPTVEPACVVLPAIETRFMVMAPGGENPRPELEPAKRKVGIRIHRQSAAMPAVLAYRRRLLAYETPAVLGRRQPSTLHTNAFGARHYQPHLALLRPGSGIDRDLTKLGRLFRDRIGDLTFDRFVIEVVQRAHLGLP